MNTESQSNTAAPKWARALLGALAALILLFTIPAYFDTTFNPALEDLTGDLAGLGSVAGAFLSRQLALATVALIGAIWGTRQVVTLGAIGLVVFNLLDAVLIAVEGDGTRGAIAGLVFALAAAGVIVATWRSSPIERGDVAVSAEEPSG